MRKYFTFHNVSLFIFYVSGGLFGHYVVKPWLLGLIAARAAVPL